MRRGVAVKPKPASLYAVPSDLLSPVAQAAGWKVITVCARAAAGAARGKARRRARAQRGGGGATGRGGGGGRRQWCVPRGGLTRATARGARARPPAPPPPPPTRHSP